MRWLLQQVQAVQAPNGLSLMWPSRLIESEDVPFFLAVTTKKERLGLGLAPEWNEELR